MSHPTTADALAVARQIAHEPWPAPDDGVRHWQLTDLRHHPDAAVRAYVRDVLDARRPRVLRSVLRPELGDLLAASHRLARILEVALAHRAIPQAPDGWARVYRVGPDDLAEVRVAHGFLQLHLTAHTREVRRIVRRELPITLDPLPPPPPPETYTTHEPDGRWTLAWQMRAGIATDAGPIRLTGSDPDHLADALATLLHRLMSASEAVRYRDGLDAAPALALPDARGDA